MQQTKEESLKGLRDWVQTAVFQAVFWGLEAHSGSLGYLKYWYIFVWFVLGHSAQGSRLLGSGIICDAKNWIMVSPMQGKHLPAVLWLWSLDLSFTLFCFCGYTQLHSGVAPGLYSEITPSRYRDPMGFQRWNLYLNYIIPKFCEEGKCSPQWAISPDTGSIFF